LLPWDVCSLISMFTLVVYSIFAGDALPSQNEG